MIRNNIIIRKSRCSLSILLVVMLISSQINVISASGGNTDSMESSIEYLKSVQNADGGFPAKEGRDSNIGVSTWVIMALTAAGEDLNSSEWKSKGMSPIDYLKNAENELEDTTEYARVLLALSATNQGTYYKGENLLNSIKAFQKDGHFAMNSDEETMINTHMWSIMAIASTGNEIPNKEEAKTWLLNNQNEDGGFSWIIGNESDSDDTGIAILTLILLGENPTTSTTIEKAYEYLESRQESDGGFSASDMMGNDSNIASDAWVMQGLLGSGENIEGTRWKKGSLTVEDHLKSLQTDDGYFEWKEGVSSSTVQMTAYGLMALAYKPFPVNIDYGPLLEIKELFTDFDSTQWSYEAVSVLVDRGVINGYDDGTFKPDKLVTRAEFTSMVIKGLELENQDSNDEISFIDVKATDWYYKYISTAFNNGIVNGKSNEIFDPNGLITGAELATMLVNSLPEDMKTYGPKGGYWYSRNVALANRYTLLIEDFDTGAFITRAECAYSIKQLLDVN